MSPSPLQEAALIDLVHHWGSAYDVCLVDDLWTAKPALDPECLLTADTADGLRTLIRRDYTQRAATQLTERSST